MRVRDLFGFTYIESGPPRPYRAGIGPLQDGPFVRREGLAVGQWGLIPEWAKSRKQAWNNARWGDGQPEKAAFRPSWVRGQRCLIPVEDYDEPYWGTGKNIWWRFARRDGEPWMIAGLWNEWTDPVSGEVIPSFTMLTINCNVHPILKYMHRPDVDHAGNVLPHDQQDKRSIVPIERGHWDTWLNGSNEAAAALVHLPPPELFVHGPADPAVQVTLPL